MQPLTFMKNIVEENMKGYAFMLKIAEETFLKCKCNYIPRGPSMMSHFMCYDGVPFVIINRLKSGVKIQVTDYKKVPTVSNFLNRLPYRCDLKKISQCYFTLLK